MFAQRNRSKPLALIAMLVACKRTPSAPLDHSQSPMRASCVSRRVHPSIAPGASRSILLAYDAISPRGDHRWLTWESASQLASLGTLTHDPRPIQLDTASPSFRLVASRHRSQHRALLPERGFDRVVRAYYADATHTWERSQRACVSELSAGEHPVIIGLATREFEGDDTPMLLCVYATPLSTGAALTTFQLSIQFPDAEPARPPYTAPGITDHGFELIAADAFEGTFVALASFSNSARNPTMQIETPRLIVWRNNDWITAPLRERIVRSVSGSSAVVVAHARTFSAAFIAQQTDGPHVRVLRWSLGGSPVPEVRGDIPLRSHFDSARVLALRADETAIAWVEDVGTSARVHVYEANGDAWIERVPAREWAHASADQIDAAWSEHDLAVLALPDG